MQMRAFFPPLYPDGTGRTQKLLAALGNPQDRLPPVIHVAGTNGKGSTLAFVESVMAAAGFRTHKYISPHLVRFEERILPYGEMIAGAPFRDLISECMAAAKAAPVSFFEFYTALALLAFSRLPADAVLLETGLGGRNDATNVVAENVTAVLTRISYDHRRVLGNELAEIAAHKAGIMKRGAPCVIAPQEPVVLEICRQTAATTGAALYCAGHDWAFTADPESFSYQGRFFQGRLPRPGLAGDHQVVNAATALAVLEQSPFRSVLQIENIRKGLAQAVWPGRLQHLEQGALIALLPPDNELWLDGAHNDSGAEVLAAALGKWSKDGPVHLITAMKEGKSAEDVYRLLAPFVASITVISDPPEAPMLPAAALQDKIRAVSDVPTRAAENLESALRAVAFSTPGQKRIVVTGSLYLVGHALRLNAEGG